MSFKVFFGSEFGDCVPQKLVSDSVETQIKFERLLQILLNEKWCSAEACDKICTQFKGFVLEMKQNHFAEFHHEYRQIG